jgi:hypothetical protein
MIRGSLEFPAWVVALLLLAVVAVAIVAMTTGHSVVLETDGSVGKLEVQKEE